VNLERGIVNRSDSKVTQIAGNNKGLAGYLVGLVMTKFGTCRIYCQEGY
jgi:hypothetical protein